jgi:hypothetical protein
MDEEISYREVSMNLHKYTFLITRHAWEMKNTIRHHRPISISLFLSVVYWLNKSFSMFFFLVLFVWLLSRDLVISECGCWDHREGWMALTICLLRFKHYFYRTVGVVLKILHGVIFFLFGSYLCLKIEHASKWMFVWKVT